MKIFSTLALVLLAASAAAQNGFTPLSPSSDSRVVYVDKSIGYDTSSCGAIQTPCQTLAYARTKMRNGYPDHLYLKRGQDFTSAGSIYPWSGRSASEPAVFAYYGSSGERPRVQRIAAFRESAPVQHFNAVGLYLEDGAGFVWDNKGILIEDCVFDQSELVVEGPTGKEPSDIRIRRNIFTGNYANTSSFSDDSRPSNIYVSNIDGLLIEDNVIDHGGWHETEPGAGGNMYNHNVYIQYSNVGNNVVVRNNIVTRASSHGIHGRPGGLYEDNFFAKNAISLQLGYHGGPALSQGTNAIARNNVITQARSMVKGDQPCNPAPDEPRLCTGAFWGLQTENPGQGYFEIVGNLIAMGEDNETAWRTKYNSLSVSPLHEDPDIVSKKIENNLIAANEIVTLADYAQYIGLQHSFDAFIDAAASRAPGTWDVKLTAKEINKFFRAQYGMNSDDGDGDPVDNEPPPSGNLLNFGSFNDGALQDMPDSYVLGSSPTNIWMARLGDCGQCSRTASSNGNNFLEAGHGTTNATFQVVAWPGSGTLALDFDYVGDPGFVVFGGHTGDTIGKWDDSHTLDVLYDGSTTTSSSWSGKSVSVELSGDYDYLVIQLRNGSVDNVSATMDAVAAQGIVSFGGFNGSALQDMPGTYTLGADPENVWMARLGSCGQCSQLLTSDGNTYLEAGYGTTNAAFQVVAWPGSGTLTVDFDYVGNPGFVLFGGYAGDTVGKWDNSNTLDVLYDGSTTTTSNWSRKSASVELSGNYDYLVIQLRNGNVDNVSAVLNPVAAQNIASFGDFNGTALQDMPGTYTLGADPENIWMARLGSCSQCSQLLNSNGNTYLDAGYGTTNAAFQVIAWPGSGSLSVDFDYIGGPGINVFGGHTGDTIGKWDDSHTLDLLYNGETADSQSWTSGSVTANLAGDYDYLVIQLRNGDIDNVSATME